PEQSCDRGDLGLRLPGAERPDAVHRLLFCGESPPRAERGAPPALFRAAGRRLFSGPGPVPWRPARSGPRSADPTGAVPRRRSVHVATLDPARQRPRVPRLHPRRALGAPPLPMNIAIHVLVLLLFPPLLLGAINKVKAAFAGRVGPPLFQAYF